MQELQNQQNHIHVNGRVAGEWLSALALLSAGAEIFARAFSSHFNCWI